MHKKILILIFLVGCATTKDDPYLLSNIPEIRELERHDHQLCTSFKLNFDRKENFINRAYWRCRLSFAKYRLGTTATQRDAGIKDLVTKISLKVAATPESVVIRENQKLDNRDHKRCLAMGFEFETEDQAKIEDYFACRKVLIDEKQVVPPYGNLDYLQYRNNSYNIGFIVDQRILAAIAHYNSTKEKYPTCISYNLYSLNFKRCKEAQDKARQCFSEIEGKKFRYEGEEKVACQKRAYLRFSDAMLKEDERKKLEIERKNKNADYYNNQSFRALGIDGTEFFMQDEEEEKTKKTPKRNNSKSGLYEKFELTKLRRTFVIACQDDASGRVEDFVTEQKKICTDLEKFEIIGED